MNKPLRLLLTLCLAVCTTAVLAHADNNNLVVNGGFETGDFSGWTVSGDGSDTGVCTASTCPGNYVPFEGNYAGYFGTVGDTTTISQMIPTVAGDTYTLSFYLANPVGGTPNYFSVAFGNSSFSFTNFGTAFNWQQFVMTTVATGDETDLSFTFRNDPSYWFLDNVSVSAQGSGGTTPEPGTLALFGTGVIGIGALVRRKLNL